MDDEIRELRLRVLGLESSIRRQDKLLRKICENLILYEKTEPSIKDAAKKYLGVFDEEEIRRV